MLMLLILLITHPNKSILPSILRYFGAALILFSVGFGTMALLQMNRHISALPSPKQGSVLLTTGIYAYVRHPMYSALSLAGIGYGVLESDWYKLLLSLLLLVFFEIKSQYEETRLVDFFPEYRDYKQRTGKFFPMIFHTKLIQ